MPVEKCGGTVPSGGDAYLEDGEVAYDDSIVRVLQRMHRASFRGAAIGLSLRGGLHAVTSAVSAMRSRGSRQRPGPPKLVDTLRWTAFLGAFGAVYVAVDEALRKFVGCAQSASYRAAVAGAVAAPTILLTGQNRHDDLALYVLLRGVTLLVRCGNEPDAPAAVRAALSPTRWRHGDAVLMCAASWQIIYAYVMMPATLPPSYIRFLNKMAGFDSWLVPVVKELSLRNVGRLPAGGPLNALQGTAHRANAAPDFCELLHPSTTCNAHAARIMPTLLQRSLAVYVPVYVASAVAVHRARLLRDPGPIIAKLVAGCARSSLFLATFVALAHRSVCAANNPPAGVNGGLLKPAGVAALAWVPGLAVLLEKKSRRMELALYCLCRALLSAYQTIFKFNVAPAWLLGARTDVLTFAAAAASIMHCYSDSYGRHRAIFRSKYLNVLDFVFGSRGLQAGAIRHHSSNRQLLLQATDTTRLRLRTLSEHSLMRVVKR